MQPLLPDSRCTGIVWPAVPPGTTAALLALHFQIEQSQWWAPEVLERFQMRQLIELLNHAAKTVPFYSDRLNKIAKLRPDKLTMERFRTIPVMNRQDIQNAGDRLRSDTVPTDHGNVSEVRSSGSTGRPISVAGTTVEALFQGSLDLRFHLSHKRDLTAKCASIIFLGQGRDAAEARFFGAFSNAGRMVLLHVFTPTGKQLDWLLREDPEYLLTYPSNLRALLQRSAETGRKPRKLRQVSCMTEVLDDSVRDACREVWGVPVVQSYSAQEAGYIAIQCPEHNGLHVQSENLIVEILDDDGRPCGPGETGRVVVTTLHNFATPLIRYEVGDYAEVGAPCPCGRSLPVLSRIMGRVRNMLVLPSGETAWPSVGGWSVSDIAPIRQLQCIQTSREHIEVKLVPERPLTQEEEAGLRTLFDDKFDNQFDLTLTYCDEIPRSARGKYEDFKSEIAG